MESYELSWPSSLKPNHVKQEPGVNGNRPLIGWVPLETLYTPKSNICSFEGREGEECVTTASSSPKPVAVTTGPSREITYLCKKKKNNQSISPCNFHNTNKPIRFDI